MWRIHKSNTDGSAPVSVWIAGDGILQVEKHSGVKHPICSASNIVDLSDGMTVWDFTDLSADLKVPLHILDRRLKDLDYGGKAAALALFLDEFGLRRFHVKLPRLCYADPNNLSEESDACYYALDPKYRGNMLDFVKEPESRYGYEAAVILDPIAANEGLGGPRLKIRVEYGITGKSQLDKEKLVSHIYKGSVVSAKAMLNMLGEVDGCVCALANALQNYVSCATVSNGYLPNFVLDGDSLAGNVIVAGTEEDIAALQGIFERLGIYTVLDEKTGTVKVIKDEDYAQAEGGAFLRNLETMSGESSNKSYGCLMYIAWLCSQGYFMKSWRGFSSMHDWMQAIGKDDLHEELGSCDCYAVLDMIGERLLVTSYGFLLLYGNLDAPERAEWMSLEGLRQRYDFGNRADEFEEEVDRFASEEGCYEYTDGSGRRAVRNYDGFAYGVGKKQKGISRIMQRATHCYRTVYDLRRSGCFKSWFYVRLVRDIDGTDIFMDYVNKRFTQNCLSGTGMEYTSGDCDTQNKTMEPLLCEVMSVLHELMERAVEVTVCKGSFGRKDAIETLTVAKAQEDEDCILLPFLNG